MYRPSPVRVSQFCSQQLSSFQTIYLLVRVEMDAKRDLTISFRALYDHQFVAVRQAICVTTNKK